MLGLRKFKLMVQNEEELVRCCYMRKMYRKSYGDKYFIAAKESYFYIRGNVEAAIETQLNFIR